MKKHYLYVPFSVTFQLMAGIIPTLVVLVILGVPELFPSTTDTPLVSIILSFLIGFVPVICVLTIWQQYRFPVKLGEDTVSFKLPGYSGAISYKKNQIEEVKWEGGSIYIVLDIEGSLRTDSYSVTTIPHDQAEVFVQYLRGEVDVQGNITPLFDRIHFAILPDEKVYGIGSLTHGQPVDYPGKYALARYRRDDRLFPLILVISPLLSILLVGVAGTLPAVAFLLFSSISLSYIVVYDTHRNFHGKLAESFLAVNTKTVEWKLSHKGLVNRVPRSEVQKIDTNLKSIIIHCNNHPPIEMNIAALHYNAAQQLKEKLTAISI